MLLVIAPLNDREALESTCWSIYRVLSIGQQLEVDAAGFVVLVVFNVAHPQLTPDLSQIQNNTVSKYF